MQITTGFRGILSHPLIYSSFQYLMGAKQGWTYFANFHIRAQKGDNILDVGCGPGDILNFLPKVNYWGFDISKTYILKAKHKYGNIANFECKYLTSHDLESLPKFDLVIATGVLHHMDDDMVIDFLKLAFKALKVSGRLVTVDPCFVSNQNPIARFIISKDRGQNVRTKEEYVKLITQVFEKVEMNIKHKIFIPYTHCYIESTRL
jgi:SAM-dependent methyltransferase